MGKKIILVLIAFLIPILILSGCVQEKKETEKGKGTAIDSGKEATPITTQEETETSANALDAQATGMEETTIDLPTDLELPIDDLNITEADIE